MIDANHAITNLYNQLCETEGQYQALFSTVKGSEFGEMVNTILSRRKDNISELRDYLCVQDTDAKTDPRSDTVSISSPQEMVASERRILAAYDEAIAPISGRHEKFDFLTAQYAWLKGVVDSLSDAVRVDASQPLPASQISYGT